MNKSKTEPLKLYGKPVADQIKEEAKRYAIAYKSLTNRNPKLAIISNIDDAASQSYVKSKTKICEECGVEIDMYYINCETSYKEVESKIVEYNKSKHIDGILLQLPLPKSFPPFAQQLLIDLIKPNKDVDCFTKQNIGELYRDYYADATIAPCTPLGVVKMLKYYNITLQGKNVVVLGRSNLVGKPLAKMLMDENATVTICHSKTQNLQQYLNNADIVISAIGKAKFFNESCLKDNAIVIDVGINRDSNGKLCGDFDSSNEQEIINKNIRYSPVPKGVGITTVASLVYNTCALTFNNVK